MTKKARKPKELKPKPLLLDEPELAAAVWEEWPGRWDKACRQEGMDSRALLCRFCDGRAIVKLVITGEVVSK